MYLGPKKIQLEKYRNLLAALLESASSVDVWNGATK